MDALKDALLNVERPLALHALVFITNLLIIFYSETILRFFNRSKSISVQAKILRFGAVIFLMMHILDILLVDVFALPEYENYFIRFGLTIATVFGCLILFNIFGNFSRQKFGTQREMDGETIYLDSYNSRLMNLCASVFVFLIALYILITIWELDGLLQTTGFLGIIFAFLALTNAIWAPDIYFGLVILNSNMLDDGDVIKINGHPDEHIIARVSLIYTMLLDVRNNHRVIIRNSQLISQRVDNLSKRASTEGLRHSLEFNIGYPGIKEERSDSDDNPFTRFMKRVDAMFETAYEHLCENTEAKINHNVPFEVVLINSGDYALNFRLYYYIEALPNTKVTKTIRQYLLRTPSLIQQAVNASAVSHGIQLATPMLVTHKEFESDDGIEMPDGRRSRYYPQPEFGKNSSQRVSEELASKRDSEATKEQEKDLEAESEHDFSLPDDIEPQDKLTSKAEQERAAELEKQAEEQANEEIEEMLDDKDEDEAESEDAKVDAASPDRDTADKDKA